MKFYLTQKGKDLVGSADRPGLTPETAIDMDGVRSELALILGEEPDQETLTRWLEVLVNRGYLGRV